MQNAEPHPGSFLENIIGNAPFGVEEAWEAAELAGLAGDIRALPMGLHTMVTDSTTISGGQCQRLMIARALVRRPRILFMDEATSALDNQTQAEIAQHIGQLKLTRVVIAHRLSTIQDADMIYVLNKGRLAEQGRFDELMAKDGVFAAMAKRQIV